MFTLINGKDHPSLLYWTDYAGSLMHVEVKSIHFCAKISYIPCSQTQNTCMVRFGFLSYIRHNKLC